MAKRRIFPILALGELETPAGASLAVLFPFNHSGIAGKITVAPKAGVISLVYLAKRPGKTMTAGSGLTIHTPAVDIDKYIEFILAGSNHKGLAYHKCMLALAKILNKFFAIYRNFSASVTYIHPSY